LALAALRAVHKGGRVVCAGIHMSDIPSFPYSILWQERELVSVANLTRQVGQEFFDMFQRPASERRLQSIPLSQANEALSNLRSGRLVGAAVLVP
jgi:propanol-preferring alcohol dehydrogenase